MAAKSLRARPEPGPFETKDDMADVAFVVEDKKLYFNKVYLSAWSPVFKAMFSADFREKSSAEIPLPGKKCDHMVAFFKQIHPIYCADPITDEGLLPLLKLADEYQVESIHKKCEQYIDHQTQLLKKELSNHQLLLYLWMGERYKLSFPRQQLLEFGATRPVLELQKITYYGNVPASAMKDLLAMRTVKLETYINTKVTKAVGCLSVVGDPVDKQCSSCTEKVVDSANHQVKITDRFDCFCCKCAGRKIGVIVKELKRRP